MKFICYLQILLLSACTTAQNFKVIEAVHYIRIGGVKGSTAEVFEIKVKNNPKLNPMYLLLGETKIPLHKDIKNGIIHLTGNYYPENPAGPEYGVPTIPLKFDLKNSYLVSDYFSSKKTIKQKIILTNINTSDLDNHNMPQ